MLEFMAQFIAEVLLVKLGKGVTWALTLGKYPAKGAPSPFFYGAIGLITLILLMVLGIVII